MKIRKLLELQSTIEERKVPRDMNIEDLTQHYSESKEDYVDILDMDLIHLVRSYSKCIGNGYIQIPNNKEVMREKLDTILRDILDIVIFGDMEIKILVNM